MLNIEKYCRATRENIMIYTPNDLVKRIHDTKAVSIWNRKTGPIFWYAASVPGPFYVNTELVIGPELSALLLKEITAIVADMPDAVSRASKLDALIMQAFEKDVTFKNVIETMVERAKAEFPKNTYSVISGGERRDWLFSIPMAKLMNVKHAYLFKNGDLFCESSLQPGEVALHVSDLINNAASYFDAWLPILTKHGLSCTGTLCVNSRGTNGVDRLKDNGQKVVALNSIDVAFFEKSKETGLIDEATLDEIRLFFCSAQEWASTYLMEKAELFNASGIDAKSFERLVTFFTKDPWNLRSRHEAFFHEMIKAIEERKAA
jgi:orotate phosphoribosyltransferase